jgi:hypothetical protein
MGSIHNRARDKWQDYSGENAGVAEKNFFEVFKEYFKDKNYRVREKPDEFKDIYVKVDLDPVVLSEIYNPPEQITKHGIRPDYAIDNITTNKTLYVEVKRQDGWVEGKPRQAGRGNAHERSCKYFTPGLMKILREQGGINDATALPFWTVFQGDITRDPCRVREITLWYEGYSNHFFLWRNGNEPATLLAHFENNLKKFLD